MCNHEIERRQAWRETDGFAKATDSVQGKARDLMWEKRVAESVKITEAGGNLSKAPSYSPLFVQMMIELHCYPDKRAYYLIWTANLPPAQKEIVSFLKRAKIVVIDPNAAGPIPLWMVDEEALKLYIDQICNVQIPRRVWVQS